MQLNWKKMFFFFFFCMEDGLTLYTTRLVCKFSIMFSMHFPKMLTRRICLTFKRFFTWWLFHYSCDLQEWFRGDIARSKLDPRHSLGRNQRDKPEMVRKKKEKKKRKEKTWPAFLKLTQKNWEWVHIPYCIFCIKYVPMYLLAHFCSLRLPRHADFSSFH